MCISIINSEPSGKLFVSSGLKKVHWTVDTRLGDGKERQSAHRKMAALDKVMSLNQLIWEWTFSSFLFANVTWLQSVWHDQLWQCTLTDCFSLSNTTKLLIAWFTSTRGVYHYYKQWAFWQTVSFFRTKESPLNSRYSDGWWKSKTKCVQPGQSKGKWPLLIK